MLNILNESSTVTRFVLNINRIIFQLSWRKNGICNECDVMVTKNKQNEFERRLLLLLADFVRLRNIYSFITYGTDAGGNSNWIYLYNFKSFIHFPIKDFTPTLPTPIGDCRSRISGFEHRQIIHLQILSNKQVIIWTFWNVNLYCAY